MRAFRILSRLLMLLGLLMVAVTLLPPRWYIGMLAGPWKEPNQGVLVVLAADGVNESMLGQSSYWRSVYAVWAWRDGHFQHLLISGDRGVTIPMRDFIVSQGVPAAAVVVEDRSNSTHENASFSVPILRGWPGPYVLLTSDYHMWRARRSFERAGIAVEPRPLPDAGKRITQWTGRWPVFLDLIVETSKIGYYWVRGWA
jgi:uncharacterized SAM-binding protein YcdF (DUF218 family)